MQHRESIMYTGDNIITAFPMMIRHACSIKRLPCMQLVLVIECMDLHVNYAYTFMTHETCTCICTIIILWYYDIVVIIILYYYNIMHTINGSCYNSSIVFSPHLWDIIIIVRGDHDRARGINNNCYQKLIFIIVILLELVCNSTHSFG